MDHSSVVDVADGCKTGDYNSTVNEQLYVCTWNIKGFNKLRNGLNYVIHGPTLRLGPEETEWELIMRKGLIEDQKCVAFLITKAESNNCFDCVTYSITLVSPEQKKLVFVQNRQVGGEVDDNLNSFDFAPSTQSSETTSQSNSVHSDEYPELTFGELFNLERVTIKCCVKYGFVTISPYDCHDNEMEVEITKNDSVKEENELKLETPKIDSITDKNAMEHSRLKKHAKIMPRI